MRFSTTAALALVATTTSTLLLSSVVVQANPTERDVLIVTYSHLGGNHWTNKQGWEDASENVCDWFGVICENEQPQNEEEDAANRALAATSTTTTINANPKDEFGTHKITNGVKGTARIIGIHLPDNNVRGRLNPSFWRLPKLQSINFNDNAELQLTFGIPHASLQELYFHGTATTDMTGMDGFGALTSLHMSGTQLGNIVLPEELVLMTSLEELHMAQCELVGSIPDTLLQSLSNLREFNVYDNALTGTIPRNFGKYVPELAQLVLARNQFSGTLPTSLESLAKLEQIYVDHNQLDGRLLGFPDSPRLYAYYADSNQFTGNLPQDLLENNHVFDAQSGQTDSYQVRQIRLKFDNNRLGTTGNGLIPTLSILSRMSDIPLFITLSNNQFIGFEDDSLCGNTLWQEDTDMREFKCDAIVCPQGTHNQLGRATLDAPCEPCDDKKSNYGFVGETLCLDGDEKSVLQSLFKATGGPKWFNRDGWDGSDSNHCNWFGVTCWNPDNHPSRKGRVEKLQLNGNNLVGTVPNFLYALELMTMASLSRNPKLEVPFEGIGQSEYLHVLDIAHTATTDFRGLDEARDFFQVLIADEIPMQSGLFPKEILALTQLEVLSMNQCGMTGELHGLEALTQLEELYLWGNFFRGTIPHALGELRELRILSLAKNRFTGPLPINLMQLTQLEALSVKDQVTKGGGLTGDLLDFAQSSRLTNLMLSHNKLEGQIPSSLLNSVSFDSVVTVDVSSNLLTGEVPTSLGKFDSMNIYLQDNLISSIADELCTLEGWQGGLVKEYGCDAILCPKYTINEGIGRREYEHQSCEACSDPNVKPILGQTMCGAKDRVMTEPEILMGIYKECNGPRWIRNKKWKATGATEDEICEWQGIECNNAKSVTMMILGSNNLACNFPTYVWELPNLQRLSLFDNPNVKMDFAQIGHARFLKELVVEKTAVKSLVGIAEARRLTELNIANNRLTGTFPHAISYLQNLETLNLAQNRFTGTIPTWIETLPDLEVLFLNDNRFTGELPNFAMLHHLHQVNVSSNLLAGQIPKNFMYDVDNSNTMDVLVDISNNELTGTIPDAWLSRFGKVELAAQENKISDLSAGFCNKAKDWNQGALGDFGCDGLLCPPGSYNPGTGRQTSDGTPCLECIKTTTYGRTRCTSAAWHRSGGSLIMVVLSLVVSACAYLTLL